MTESGTETEFRDDRLAETHVDWRLVGCGHCGYEWGTAESVDEMTCPDCGADFDREVNDD